VIQILHAELVVREKPNEVNNYRGLLQFAECQQCSGFGTCAAHCCSKATIQLEHCKLVKEALDPRWVYIDIHSRSGTSLLLIIAV
jgi:coenzyme F420-reducing hydrogenase gamma subunit